MKTYIISLQSEKERREFQKWQMTNLSIDFEFFDAIQISDISDEEYENKSQSWARKLKKVELACYLSHKAIWEKIIFNDSPALILEDDAYLSKETKKIMDILQKENGIDYVDFETVGRKKIIATYKKIQLESSALYRLYQKSSGAGAYILWPSGSKKLLDFESKNGIFVVDKTIAQTYKLNSFQVDPAIAVQFYVSSIYDIQFDGIEKLKNSTTTFDPREKNEFKYFLKRAKLEIKKGLRRVLFFINIFNRRKHISIQKEKFPIPPKLF
jgi:glycosyl transferase family 25